MAPGPFPGMQCKSNSIIRFASHSWKRSGSYAWMKLPHRPTQITTIITIILNYIIINNNNNNIIININNTTIRCKKQIIQCHSCGTRSFTLSWPKGQGQGQGQGSRNSPVLGLHRHDDLCQAWQVQGIHHQC